VKCREVWEQDANGKWFGNPLKSDVVNNYLSGIEKVKTKNGETPDRSLPMSYANMVEVRYHMKKKVF
jgi:hypothetical protein